MNVKIEPLPTFKREAKRLNKHYASFADDYEKLIAELENNPHLGTDLGGGLRKIRMAITSKGKGKSGGARVICFTSTTRRSVLLSARKKSKNCFG